MTDGLGVLWSSSIESALRPQTLQANSMTLIWKPKQIPRNGILLLRAYFVAAIMPSVPLWPKPPGIRMPSAPWIVCQAISDSSFWEPSSRDERRLP